jgi:hypothetical protein
MFLSVIFGEEADDRVVHLYELEIPKHIYPNLPMQETSIVHNLFRALVVHPAWAETEATRLVVDWLAVRQLPKGDWGPIIPFFQALNALAHLDLPEADRQIEKALPHLAGSQNPDGTWGESETEWKTFLVIHALRNKGLI